VEKTGRWKPWKSPKRFSTAPTIPWKSRGGIPTFPQLRRRLPSLNPNRKQESRLRQAEGERQAKIAEVNARLATQRAAANAEADAARLAARDQIAAAVSDVAGLASELATGRRPGADVVTRVVDEVMAR